MFLVCTLLVAATIVAYGVRYRIWASPAVDRPVVAALVALLLLLMATTRGGDAMQPGADPVFLAIAADVSLSMGTRPDPFLHTDTGTRLERVQGALLPLLADLGASPRPALVSVNAFTSKSETILAWDDDLALAREIVRYVLSTGLLTEAGSDLGAALGGTLPLFESLPESYRDAGHAKFLILVSDGEQTVSRASAASALAKLRESGVRIIALHAGLDEPREGLPVFDDDGAFIGFEEVGGQTFSLPDPGLMQTLSGDDSDLGLYVKVEQADAVPAMLDFIGVDAASAGASRFRVGTILVLWGLTLFVLIRWA